MKIFQGTRNVVFVTFFVAIIAFGLTGCADYSAHTLSSDASVENVRAFAASRTLRSVRAAGAEDGGDTTVGAERNTADSANDSAKQSVADDATASVNDAATAIQTILSKGDATFFGYEPIDESFLSWFADTYGEKELFAVAKKVNRPAVWKQKTKKSIHVLYADYENTIGMPRDSRTYQMETADKNEVTMTFTGDLQLAEGMATTAYLDTKKRGLSACFSKDLRSELRCADICMINNEFAYTDRGTPLAGKDYTFRANPSRVNELSKLGVDYVNLANNHVYDFGDIGMTDTLDTLRNANFPYVGAGYNLNEAMQPLYFLANNLKIAVVSATQIERSTNFTHEATADTAGVLKTLDPTKFVSVIREADKRADVVIVIVHWGTEGNAMYGADQINLANAFVVAGADAIIGGHTHCLEGIEYINDVPTYYSLGNFWFALADWMPEPYDTGVAKLAIQNDGTITPYFLPCRFEKGVTSLSQGDEAERIDTYVETLSQTTTIDESGKINQK